MWIVKKFIKEYNHGEITPSRLHLLNVIHKVRNAKKQLMKQFKGANISTSKAMVFFGHKNEIYNQIGCT